MEQYVVELAAVFRRKGSAIASAPTHLSCPRVRACRIAKHREGQALFRFLAGLLQGTLIQKEWNCIETGAVYGADLRNRSAEFAGQFQRVNFTAAGLHQ